MQHSKFHYTPTHRLHLPNRIRFRKLPKPIGNPNRHMTLRGVHNFRFNPASLGFARPYNSTHTVSRRFRRHATRPILKFHDHRFFSQLFFTFCSILEKTKPDTISEIHRNTYYTKSSYDAQGGAYLSTQHRNLGLLSNGTFRIHHSHTFA